MAQNGKLTAPVNGWIDVTGGVPAQWMLCEVLESTPAQCPGVWIRFQAGNPGSEIEGHVLRRGAGDLGLGAQMDKLGGRAWARSMSDKYPAQLFVTAVDA